MIMLTSAHDKIVSEMQARVNALTAEIDVNNAKEALENQAMPLYFDPSQMTVYSTNTVEQVAGVGYFDHLQSEKRILTEPHHGNSLGTVLSNIPGSTRGVGG